MNDFLKNLFRALKYRNFRLFFVGQSISLLGVVGFSCLFANLIFYRRRPL